MLPIEFSEIFNDPDFIEPITVLRSTISYVNEGEAVKTYGDPLFVDAIVMPAEPADLQLLPEGERLGNVMLFYTTSKLLIGNAKDEVGDVVVHNGTSYKCFKQENYSSHGYYRTWGEGFVPGTPEATP